MIKPKTHPKKALPPAHIKLIRTVQDVFMVEGWKLALDACALSRDCKDIVASFMIDFGFPPPKGFEFMLAIKNSNAARWALSLNAGIRNKTSGAMLAVGRVRPGTRRHHPDDRELIQQSVQKCLELFRYKAHEQVLTLKSMKLDPQQATFELVEIGQKKILPWSKIGKISQLPWAGLNALGLAQAVALEIDGAPACARRDQVELRLLLSEQLGVA